MNILNNLNFKQVHVLKIAGLAVVGMVSLAFVVRLFGASFSSLMPRSDMDAVGSTTAGSYAYDSYGGVGMKAYPPSMPELSARNLAPQPSMPQGVPGKDAEMFETKRYNGVVETRHLKDTCGEISAWKAKDYIIFEQANESDRTCDYTFKVERAHVEEVLAQVKALQPKDLSENIQSIKRQIDDFTSEKDILEKKLASIEKTLTDAIQSYEEIAVIATRSQDAASLARIIESKLQIIERLTQERMAINEQLARLERMKTEQVDQVDYTYFSLSVYENKFVDAQMLKDSWKTAIKTFVYDVNRILQDITINLVTLIFFVVQYVLYFFILLVVAKYVYRLGKYIWKK